MQTLAGCLKIIILSLYNISYKLTKNQQKTNKKPTKENKAVWSSGMILALGASGREFDSRNGPMFPNSKSNRK